MGQVEDYYIGMGWSKVKDQYLGNGKDNDWNSA